MGPWNHVRPANLLEVLDDLVCLVRHLFLGGPVLEAVYAVFGAVVDEEGGLGLAAVFGRPLL